MSGTLVGDDSNISGSVPWFYDPATKKPATLYPTVLSASVDVLASIPGNISRLIRGRLADGADRSAGYFGADLDIAVAQNLDLELGGEATFGSDITGGRFNAALVAKF